MERAEAIIKQRDNSKSGPFWTAWICGRHRPRKKKAASLRMAASSAGSHRGLPGKTA
jgi:hypothetical protein